MRTEEAIEAEIQRQKEKLKGTLYLQIFSEVDIRDAKIQALEWVLEKLKDLI